MAMRALKAELPGPLAEKVSEMAEQLGHSTDWVVREAVTSWIERQERERRLVLEGLADVAAGRIVDHEAVRAWADSLGTDNPLPVPRPQKCG